MNQLAATPLSLSNIFITSAKLWKTVFKSVFPLVLIAFIFFILPYFIVPELNSLNLNVRINRVFQFGSGVIFYWLVSVIFYTAIYYHAFKTLHSEYIGFWTSLWVGVKKLLWVSMAIIVGAFLIAVGYLAFAIPGIFLTVVFVIYLPLIITENLNTFNGLKDAIELIWGNWWRTAFVVGIPSFLFMLLNLAIEIYGRHFGKVPHPVSGDLFLFQHLS